MNLMGTVPIKFSISALYKNSHARQLVAVICILHSIDALTSIVD